MLCKNILGVHLRARLSAHVDVLRAAGRGVVLLVVEGVGAVQDGGAGDRRVLLAVQISRYRYLDTVDIWRRGVREESWVDLVTVPEPA